MKNGNYGKSPVKMIAKDGSEQWFESISKASLFAKANSWTMSLKMQVFGYFEDQKGNKYYRLHEMNTKNTYTSCSPKMIKEQKKHKRYKQPKKGIPVYVDGVFYENCAQASKALGLHKSSISAYIGWGRRKINGHIIETAEEHQNKLKETFQQIDVPSAKIEMPKPLKNTHSILIETDNPAIKLINEEIVKILKKAGVYEEVKKLSEAIAKLSK